MKIGIFKENKLYSLKEVFKDYTFEEQEKILKGLIELKLIKKISKISDLELEDLLDIDRIKIEKGDILYTKVGATYGIATYIDTNVEFCLYVSVCLIKPKHYLINAKFLSIQMNMPFIKYQADNRIKGIGVPDLHLNQIREFDVIVPPLDLQNRFADYVSSIDKSKLAVKKSLEELEILKKSLMQKYFA
mgnify:CR=1 FL=1